jgi:hypothetical protein
MMNGSLQFNKSIQSDYLPPSQLSVQVPRTAFVHGVPSQQTKTIVSKRILGYYEDMELIRGSSKHLRVEQEGKQLHSVEPTMMMDWEPSERAACDQPMLMEWEPSEQVYSNQAETMDWEAEQSDCNDLTSMDWELSYETTPMDWELSCEPTPMDWDSEQLIFNDPAPMEW